MALTFYPKAGCVLMCDFDGYVEPEIIKVRPVVIVTTDHLKRGPLFGVVPLSSTAPDHVEPYHYKLAKDPIPNSKAEACWAKCDMVATVRLDRLDRFRVGHRAYKTSGISKEELEAIRQCLKYVFGIN